MILGLYRTAAILGEPLIRLVLARRRQRGKEDGIRFGERFGIASLPRPETGLAWIHAASVGEAISVLSLINRLREDRPNLTLLVTTGTVTSAAIMAGRLPAEVLYQYAPVDHPRWISRFLDHWRPDLALWLESEFWPNTLSALANRDIPIVLINARISPKSFAGWSRFRGTITTLLNTFSLCLAQSVGDGDKLTALGARDVRVPGNLKFAAAPLPASETDLHDLARMIGDRPVWAAVSTHPGEEDIVASAHSALARQIPGLLTFIVPRHPVRGADIANQLQSAGQGVARRAAGQAIDADTGIYVVDTVGELGLIYRLAKVAFIGGSLVPHGGQNLLEAAKLDCAIVHGPCMTNFTAIVDEMRQAAAIEEISDCGQLTTAVATLLRDDNLRGQRIAAASRVAMEKDSILDSVLEELAPFLDTAAPRQEISAVPARCHAQS
jgi:3-deoxy-D-manno-octulosonic-acid transferase